jgi:hypothetical protein
LRFLDRYQKQSYWQNSTGWSTTHTDRTRLSRGVRLWKSSSNGRRLDHPTSSHRNWTTHGGHVKVNSAILKKTKSNFATEQQFLFIDISNLLFHEGVHEAPVLAQKENLNAAISAAVESSKFQSVLIFTYAWVPAGVGNGATLTDYYSRVDRSDISVPSKLFLDSHYPLGNIWVHGHLHKRV